MNCKHHIKIKSLKFFSGKPGDFCLAQRSGHPMLFEKDCCKDCTLCEETADMIPEFTEEQSDNKFGIWDFLTPNETWKK